LIRAWARHREFGRHGGMPGTLIELYGRQYEVSRRLVYRLRTTKRSS
jgi:hypothetical protein